MEKILVSACLLGEPVRYNGTDCLCDALILKQWQQEGRLIPLCPELAGGLPTPRPAAEIVQAQGQDVLRGEAAVRDRDGHDYTYAFLKGAYRARAVAQQYGIQMAIMTEKSPSCGSETIYDGGFSGNKIAGQGVAVAALSRANVKVFSQHQLVAASAYLQQLESA